MVVRLVVALLVSIGCLALACRAAEEEASDQPVTGPSQVGSEDRGISAYFGADFPCHITRVAVGHKSVTVEGMLASESRSARLIEAPIWRGIPPWSATPIILNADEAGTFQVKLPRGVRTAENQRDRLFSQWALAKQNGVDWELRSHAHLPDEIAASQSPSQLVPRSKKGLGGFDAARGFVSDLDALGIASVTVNVMLNFLHLTPGENREEFRYLGNAYFVDMAAIHRYDQTFLETAKRNVLTLAIVLVPPPRSFADREVGALMCHPDYDSAGIYAMPNVTAEDGFTVYCAALEYLAQRYCRADSKYGRIHHWIAHNECDAGWMWTNAGHKTQEVYLDVYYRSLRTIYNIVRQYDPHAQVFISLTHFWNWTEDEKYYLPHEMLDRLCEMSRQEGDFQWGIAYHPYAESLSDPKTWEDARATTLLDSPLITMKNIEVLAAWSRNEATWYRGEHPRKIHLTEQGFNSRDYSPEQLQLQAAAMAYAWKKLENCPEIAGFQYHNWVDNRGEGGLRIGLRRFPDDPQQPSAPKPIWNVYRELGTDREDAACEFAKPLIGIDDWNEISNGADIE